LYTLVSWELPALLFEPTSLILRLTAAIVVGIESLSSFTIADSCKERNGGGNRKIEHSQYRDAQVVLVWKRLLVSISVHAPELVKRGIISSLDVDSQQATFGSCCVTPVTFYQSQFSATLIARGVQSYWSPCLKPHLGWHVDWTGLP